MSTAALSFPVKAGKVPIKFSKMPSLLRNVSRIFLLTFPLSAILSTSFFLLLVFVPLPPALWYCIASVSCAIPGLLRTREDALLSIVPIPLVVGLYIAAYASRLVAPEATSIQKKTSSGDSEYILCSSAILLLYIMMQCYEGCCWPRCALGLYGKDSKIVLVIK